MIENLYAVYTVVKTALLLGAYVLAIAFAGWVETGGQ